MRCAPRQHAPTGPKLTGMPCCLLRAPRSQPRPPRPPPSPPRPPPSGTPLGLFWNPFVISSLPYVMDALDVSGRVLAPLSARRRGRAAGQRSPHTPAHPPARPPCALSPPVLQSFPGTAGSTDTYLPEFCSTLLLSKRYATFE